MRGVLIMNISDQESRIWCEFALLGTSSDVEANLGQCAAGTFARHSVGHSTRGFERNGKRESFAAKAARSHTRGGIVVNQAFRQASEIAHVHTSTHDGWQPFLQILSSTFLLAKTDDDATTRGFLRIETEA